MIKLRFPFEPIQIREGHSGKEIFDIIRKKWLVLTPEEWVRQHVLQYLLVTKNYPSSLIAVEKEIRLGELRKRCDIVVYNRKIEPWMIIECKEMNVSLSEKALAQILRYHISLPAVYLIITNGKYCYGFKKTNGTFMETGIFPDFEP